MAQHAPHPQYSLKPISFQTYLVLWYEIEKFSKEYSMAFGDFQNGDFEKWILRTIRKLDHTSPQKD